MTLPVVLSAMAQQQHSGSGVDLLDSLGMAPLNASANASMFGRPKQQWIWRHFPCYLLFTSGCSIPLAGSAKSNKEVLLELMLVDAEVSLPR